ncbi:hypothetical protein SADUNF_Sadunf07G0072400 [Salix dunnii]|uniref:RNA polymerase Rpb4/RPC9 core domain-containing protein n=1 Tax=Salix dunnii TaxID=1413687 RepID=A0A835JZM6_9ROSI|nr:hypothetical protein SADUNF_Sadunf07G0072400 [Salix dunnii]
MRPSSKSEMHKYEQLQQMSDDPMNQVSQVFEKSLQYVKRFSRYKNPNALCVLGNLCPETVEEAIAMVPSIKVSCNVLIGLELWNTLLGNLLSDFLFFGEEKPLLLCFGGAVREKTRTKLVDHLEVRFEFLLLVTQGILGWIEVGRRKGNWTLINISDSSKFFLCSPSSNNWMYSWCEVAHQAVLKVILREISSLNSGMCLVMIDTRIASLYSILKLKGLFFVHDLSQRRTKASLQKWASEISVTGTFSAPLSSGGPCGLPVPYIVIGNKSDVAAKEGTRGSSSNLVDAARQWVEKQGLLPPSEEIPLTESFPGSGGLIAAAKKARYDKEAVVKKFRTLIRRRYFSEELPAPSPWSAYPVQRSVQRLDENTSDEDPFYKTTSLAGDPYKYNTLPPLPAQRNLTPPPTLYPQQPVSVTESYSVPRFTLTGSQVISNTARSKRMDINV